MGESRSEHEGSPTPPGGAERRNRPERRVVESERADQVRNEFFAILSHELRNPIHAIHTNALLIKSRTRDAEVTRPAEAIDRQVDRLSRIINDLLDVVKIAQQEELSFQTVSVQQVVGDAVEAIRLSADTHRRELTVAMPEAALYVRGDTARIKQAIGNVINNAVKYSAQQAEILVRVYVEGDDAVVAVRDQGVGIAAEELDHVFTRFTRGATRSNSSGGLGLGLHIAKELMLLHGGTIEVRSEGRGKGAEFLLRFPLTAERPADQPHLRAQYSEAQSLRILVVDDNRDAADSLAMLLEVNGHTGLVAYDGAAALDKAEKMRPHVALVDIGMPEMNGFELAQRISQAPWGREIVLVAVTGWGAKSDRAKSKEAGFAYHLTKPVDYDTLASLLSNATRKQRD